MIDVGRKIITHEIKGFLARGIVTYLHSFNLAARQIWITRHGESMDNLAGKIGGNSDLSETGRQYGHALYQFITDQRRNWIVDQQSRVASTHFPPLPGDTTPPYPSHGGNLEDKNFCVWTSMLKRSMQTAEYFNLDED